ncbi:MAG: histidine triad nucleotide-binding protein [Candidatus Zixiibacteriota bacterium]|nr:MAG: histidine triad nucleotide-binding protein [candidate division Zixibacteria bacterium]
MSTVFERIINRELPAKIFHEDNEVIVIADHRPRAEVHLLIIPKEVSHNFYETDSEILTMLDNKVKIIAEKLGIVDHFQVIINNGYCQEIDHLHYHFLSDRGAENLHWLNR